MHSKAAGGVIDCRPAACDPKQPVGKYRIWGFIGLVMRSFIIALTVALFFDPLSAQPDETNGALSRDLTILRQTFEEPLRVEFQYRGLTPRNAAVASQFVFDKLAECWISDRNLLAISDAKITAVRLGGKAIITYASPCIDELVDRVSDFTLERVSEKL